MAGTYPSPTIMVGTVARTLVARSMDLPNFADSGAAGDGTTDDTAALNTWLASLPSPSLAIMDRRQYPTAVKVYPPSGMEIGGQAPDVAWLQSGNAATNYTCASATAWLVS